MELYGNHIDLLELPIKINRLYVVVDNLSTFSQITTSTFVGIVRTDSLTAFAFIWNQFWAYSVLPLQVYNLLDFRKQVVYLIDWCLLSWIAAIMATTLEEVVCPKVDDRLIQQIQTEIKRVVI